MDDLASVRFALENSSIDVPADTPSEEEQEQADAAVCLADAERMRRADAGAGDDSWASPKLQLDHWYKSEGVAMHFNDLLMRFRLQALGGLSVVAAFAGLSSKQTAEDLRGVLPFLIAFFFVAWCGLWTLDHCYYSKLLDGAVREVIAVEARLPMIKMSHKIRRTARSGVAKWSGDIFYGLIGLVLLVFNVLAASWAHSAPAKGASSASAPAASASPAASAPSLAPASTTRTSP